MNFKNFFSLKKGTATGIAMGFSSGIILVSAGATTFVINTLEENRDLEGSVVSYYVAERGIEYALYDVSGHLPGYEVKPDIETGNEYGRLKGTGRQSKTEVEVSSRAESVNTIVTLPIQGKGSDPTDNDWNILSAGKTISIPLYIDNTAIE